MLFSVKMMAILHLSDEKGTEKRDLKIATVLSVRRDNWQPESHCLAGRSQEATSEKFGSSLVRGILG